MSNSPQSQTAARREPTERQTPSVPARFRVARTGMPLYLNLIAAILFFGVAGIEFAKESYTFAGIWAVLGLFWGRRYQWARKEPWAEIFDDHILFRISPRRDLVTLFSEITRLEHEGERVRIKFQDGSDLAFRALDLQGGSVLEFMRHFESSSHVHAERGADGSDDDDGGDA